MRRFGSIRVDWVTFACALAVLLPGCVVARAHGQASGSGDPATQSAVAAGNRASAASEPTTEESLRRRLTGKSLYLRSGYLDNILAFDEHGHLIGHSPQGSYTLCLVQIDRVRLTRRKVELQGARYGVHFLGASPNEDPTRAFDTVNITPKKKHLLISIEREIVVKPKKKKKENAESFASNTTAPQSADLNASDTLPNKDADEAVTTTTSPAHAAQLLDLALDTIFAPGLDDRMIASLPDYWQLYFRAAAAHTDFQPADSSILRESTVDQKALLLAKVEPPSNEFAQSNGIAGMALYHLVLGPDGHPQQVAISRPIGFGLDENAVDAIRKAAFKPAMKDGKPVPVLLDVMVQFRIYSKRTAASSPDTEPTPPGPGLPGPYSVQQP